MEISIADAAAAAQVQMNNELSVQTTIANTTAAGVSGTPASAAVASDARTTVEVDGDDVSNQHEGVMPQSAIDALNQTDRKLYYAALNKLVVAGGVDGYTFIDENHVRCNICARGHVDLANSLKPRARGRGNGEAVIHLPSRFNVITIVYSGYTQKGEKSTRQPGHHHAAHGCFKDANVQSEADKAAAVAQTERSNLRVWTTAYKPVSPSTKPELANLSLPGIKLIKSYAIITTPLK